MAGQRLLITALSKKVGFGDLAAGKFGLLLAAKPTSACRAQSGRSWR
jgi:hypothetical protein